MSTTGVATDEPIFNLLSIKVQDGLKALAGGGQSGVQLQSGFGMYRFSTVSNNNDSATLPPAVQGKIIFIVNADASHSLNLFPYKGDQINAVGANNAFAVASNKVALCVGTATANGNAGIAGQWHTILTA